MNEDLTLPSLKTLFRFPFQTPGWQSRFIIGTALIYASFIIPVLPLVFLYGYLIRIMRQAIRGETLALPAWEQWGKLGKDGLRLWVVSLGYTLPGLLLSIGGMVIYFVSLFAFSLFSATAEASDAAYVMLPFSMLGAMGVLFLSMFVGTLFTILGMLPLPMAMAHFVETDRVSAAFQVRQWWPLLRSNKLGYFVAWVVVIGLFAVLYLSTMLAYYTIILCWLIPVLLAPFSFYLAATSMAVWGQTYRQSAALAALEQAKSEA